VPSADAAGEQIDDCCTSPSPERSDAARRPAVMLGRPRWFECLSHPQQIATALTLGNACMARIGLESQHVVEIQ